MGNTLLFDMFHDCIFNHGPESVHSTMTSIPAPIRKQPIRDFMVNSSCRKIKASTFPLNSGTVKHYFIKILYYPANTVSDIFLNIFTILTFKNYIVS